LIHDLPIAEILRELSPSPPRTLAVCEAAALSAREGRAVTVAEVESAESVHKG
jgi:hypothetical protein